MMDEWVKLKDDFDYVLCLDVRRWANRFRLNRVAIFVSYVSQFVIRVMP